MNDMIVFITLMEKGLSMWRCVTWWSFYLPLRLSLCFMFGCRRWC